MAKRKPLKEAILYNLPDLRSRVDLTKATPQTILLESEYFEEESTNTYRLTVDLVITKKHVNGENEIRGFEIENIFFVQNSGQKPDFTFSKREITDYLDF